MENAVKRPSGSRAPRTNNLKAAEVTERLRRQIQNGEWTPGEWLREARLCEEFEIGRSVARRALRNLADDGLVVLEPNRGASVTVTTLQEVFDLYELRAGLYGVAARFACIRASARLMAEIVRNTDILLAAYNAGAPADELIRKSEEIFSLMARAGSADTQKMIEAVRRKTRWHYSYDGLAESHHSDGIFEHWTTMRSAFIIRDAAVAAESARGILYIMQNEVGRLMLSRGLGMQNLVEFAQDRRRARAARKD